MTAVVLFALNLPLVRVLSISNRKNFSERIYSRDGAAGFVINYTHSVNKGRVHDFYAPSGGDLLLYKTEFVSYGAGMPELAETEGAVFRVIDGTYEISNINRRLPSLVMAVGVIAEHSICIGSDFKSENERFLKDFFAPQTSLVFEIKRVSLAGYFFCNKNLDTN